MAIINNNVCNSLAGSPSNSTVSFKNNSFKLAEVVNQTTTPFLQSLSTLAFGTVYPTCFFSTLNLFPRTTHLLLAPPEKSLSPSPATYPLLAPPEKTLSLEKTSGKYVGGICPAEFPIRAALPSPATHLLLAPPEKSLSPSPATYPLLAPPEKTLSLEKTYGEYVGGVCPAEYPSLLALPSGDQCFFPVSNELFPSSERAVSVDLVCPVEYSSKLALPSPEMNSILAPPERSLILEKSPSAYVGEVCPVGSPSLLALPSGDQCSLPVSNEVSLYSERPISVDLGGVCEAEVAPSLTLTSPLDLFPPSKKMPFSPKTNPFSYVEAISVSDFPLTSVQPSHEQQLLLAPPKMPHITENLPSPIIRADYPVNIFSTLTLPYRPQRRTSSEVIENEFRINQVGIENFRNQSGYQPKITPEQWQTTPNKKPYNPLYEHDCLKAKPLPIGLESYLGAIVGGILVSYGVMRGYGLLKKSLDKVIFAPSKNDPEVQPKQVQMPVAVVNKPPSKITQLKTYGAFTTGVLTLLALNVINNENNRMNLWLTALGSCGLSIWWLNKKDTKLPSAMAKGLKVQLQSNVPILLI